MLWIPTLLTVLEEQKNKVKIGPLGQKDNLYQNNHLDRKDNLKHPDHHEVLRQLI